MTREEANDKVYDLTYQRESTETEIYELVDRIYNDFESMTCENCVHFVKNNELYQGCMKYAIYFGIDFGCNRFERKETK